jgi:hypothetical protein
MATRQEEINNEYKRLRKYLNPSIKGPEVDAILYALATMSRGLVHNVEAVHDQLYIVSAVGKYLDQRLADYGIIRPASVGLSDEIFKEIGIEIINRKQVRDLIHLLLRTMYGEEFTNASIQANTFEPYALQDGDDLILSVDDGDPIIIKFTSDQFSNIGAATAQEVADAITKGIRKLDLTGSGVAKDDGLGGYVTLFSDTSGPSSTIKVLGGRSQNEFKFDAIRPTSGDASTQWTIEQQPGGTTRATWTGGADPNIGKVKVGDYTNIFGSAFDDNNKGTFNVLAVKGGTVGNAYVEYDNPLGLNETQLQGSADGFLFFNPERKTLNSKLRFAAAYQTESRVLEIFMPAVTKVVRRDRQGAAHLHDPEDPNYVPNDGTFPGPYIFDLSKPYVIGDVATDNNDELNSGSNNVIQVTDSSNFPDEQGTLVFGFGTSHEEGPVPYIARPSNNSLMISPAYKFKKVHPAGTDISLIIQNSPYIPDKDGTDYPFYLTDSISGRLYAEDLIKTVAATGIRLVITILYPSDVGLGKYGTPYSEKVEVWGDDGWSKVFQINEDEE